MATQETSADTRTASQVMRQWEKLEAVKRSLVKSGMLSGDATPAQVLEKLRTLVAPDLFQKT